MADPHSPSLWKRLSPIVTLATIALVVTMLSFGQSLLIPLALALVIAFFLTPFVKGLERRGLGRGFAVAIVMVALLGALGAFGYLLGRQVMDLSTQMPRYSASMRRKVASLRARGTRSISAIPKTVDKVVSELDEKVAETDEAQPVRVIPNKVPAFERIQGMIAPILEPLAKVVVTLVLVVFMLIQREDLRNRFIRLVGSGRVTLTTRTMDDAAHRISRFLLVQSLINSAFGVLVTSGLLLIGVPYAALWGFVAAVLRFVPYVGSTLACLMPIFLAFGQFETWWQTFATLGLYLVLDLVAAYAIEPVAIGAGTGVSSFALLVMTIFWTWLWGPLGLVLAVPLTVCLTVLGKQVRPLGFIGVLLGDDAPLAPDLVFYQRLLAKDEDEASDLLEEQLAGKPPSRVYDEIALPSLRRAQLDLERGEISREDHGALLGAMRAILPYPEAHPSEEKAPSQVEMRPTRILAVPAVGEADELLVEMFTRLADPRLFEIEPKSSAALTSEIEASVRAHPPELLLVTAAPPGGLLHAQNLCKRLRKQFPTLRLLVLRPAPRDGWEKASSRLLAAGASSVAIDLTDALEQARQALAARPDQIGAAFSVSPGT